MVRKKIMSRLSKTRKRAKLREGNKKRLLGTFIIITFVALIAIIAMKYLVVYQIDLTSAVIYAAAISLFLLFIIEMRGTNRKSRKSKKRTPRKKKR